LSSLYRAKIIVYSIGYSSRNNCVEPKKRRQKVNQPVSRTVIFFLILKTWEQS